MANKVALIGLGPHAKRIYLNYLKKHNTTLSLVVDLKSQKETVKKYLVNNGFKNTCFFEIDDKYKDYEHLPEDISEQLLVVCKTMEITHIVISTEPKAHNMYIEFALKNNIHVLTDKPITVGKNMTSIKSIKKVRKQYYDILNLATNSKAMCKVMCQRQYHKGYEYIKKLLDDIVSKYKIPITYIDIYHCDGNWEMPHDLLKENHPYKYGYGKLFHSGYHFIDLLSDFIKINNQLSDVKKITNGEIYSSCFTPNDELGVCTIEDYKRLFKNQNIPDYYNENDNPNFKKFGEKNFYGQMKFTNYNHQTITTANLNLLHYGFSRRGWIESKDYYKKNGRIRHERINIQVGTLLNIQIHSYQSKEIKDRTDNLSEEYIGGLEHFDIDIYRNTDIIGGKPFERIKLGDLYTDKEKEDILGYNELSREQYLSNFFKGKCDKGDIRDQALAIEIMYSCALGIHNHYVNKKNVE
ncbi:MAG: Gfo/Idh/MocA family oxidoreductase, partial [Clostridia bacterium]|nr:Gfo/Idh/MocA family oxidoreductase [Clostridia bacterium]